MQPKRALVGLPLVLFILLAACGPLSPASPPAAIVTILSSDVPATRSLANPGTQPGPIETPTPAPPMPTLTPTIFLKGTAQADFLKNSIDLASTAFESVTVDGFLVLENPHSGYSFYNMKNKKIVGIGKNLEAINIYAVSPNRKLMLAGACPTDKCNYILRTVDKIIKTNIPTGDDWIVLRWLDNERVIFLPRLQPNQPLQPQNEVIYNVFTGEKSDLHLYLPNPKTINNNGGPGDLFEASLDPTLKRVVYNNQSGRLVLWNLDTQKEMASLPLAADTDQFRSDGWSPDGKKFVTLSPAGFQHASSGESIPTANELFMFDVDGNLTQLTHYNQNLQFANIDPPLWSPDNRHIAFGLTTGDDSSNPENFQRWLAIFDTSTLETKLYRSASNTIFSASDILSLSSLGLDWSPDGQQLIVGHWDANLTLVDLAHETKSVIPGTEGTWAGDWMAP